MTTKSGNKTVANSGSVDEFIDSLDSDQQIEDSKVLVDIFNRATSKTATMWGTAMIGYGNLKITYASGREVEWFNVGFCPILTWLN